MIKFKKIDGNGTIDVEMDHHIGWQPSEGFEALKRLANLTKEDVLYDLGCGDARTLVRAAKMVGCRCVGIDCDPVRIKDAKFRITEAKVEHLVEIKQDNLFKVDLGDATVVYLFLLAELNMRLKSVLNRKPGLRVVSTVYPFTTREYKVIEPKKKLLLNNGLDCCYLYVTPIKE